MPSFARESGSAYGSANLRSALVITHHALNYDGPQVRYLAESLAALPVRVELLGPISPEYRPAGVVVRRIAFDRLRNLKVLLLGLKACLLRRYDAVFAIDEIPCTSVLLAGAMGKRGRRVLYFLDLFDDLPPSRAYWLARRVIGRFARHATLILDTNEHRMARRRDSLGGVTRHAVLHNAPPLLETLPGPDPVWEQAPADSVRLAYAGSIRPNALLETVVRALAAVEQPVFFVVAGDHQNPYGRQLQTLAQQRLKHSTCLFTGRLPRERLVPLLVGADIGVALYGTDSTTCLNEIYCSPNKVYECMAAGLPTIASNNPTMVDLVEKNAWGICVPPDDTAALASALSRLAVDRALRREMARMARSLHLRQMNFQSQMSPVIQAAFNTNIS